MHHTPDRRPQVLVADRLGKVEFVTATFVLVHGAFCNSAVWAPTVRELALRGHRALAVDLEILAGLAERVTAAAR